MDKVVSPGDRVLVVCRATKGTAQSIARATAAAGGRAATPYHGSMWDLVALHDIRDSAPTSDSASDSAASTSAQAATATSSRSSISGSSQPFAVICVEVDDVYGSDVVCDAIALVRLLRCVFEEEPRCDAPNQEKQAKQPPRALTVLVRSRNLSTHARMNWNAHKFMDPSSAVARSPSKIPTSCIHAVGVNDYRLTVPYVVQKGDVCLEIGCCVGTTTELIAKHAGPTGRVVGIDIGRSCIEQAIAAHHRSGSGSGGGGSGSGGGGGSKVEYLVGDAWDTASLYRISQSFNVIYLDVGGISGADGEMEALALLRQLVCAFARRPADPERRLRAIVTKSRCLRDHANSWIHCDAVLRP
jgi:SAM-dependent methyltransferase